MHEVMNGARPTGRRRRLAVTLSAAMSILVLAAMPLQATAVPDGAHDFLSTYDGPRNDDLDILSVDANRSGQSSVTLVANMAGRIGSTAGAAYIWGIDRGKSFEPFPGQDPSTGQGVTFDSYVIMRADGTGTFTDLVAGTTQTLDPRLISIHDAQISLTLSAGLLGTVDGGFAFNDFLYNFWPRFAPDGVSPGNNRQISDFAPADHDFPASVPEPASWAMMLGGFGLIGGMMRSRRKTAVSFG
jgi:hypothetical protein